LEEIRNTGFIGYGIGAAILIYLVVYLILRMVFGKCGGFKSQRPDITKVTKATPGILILAGFIVFLVGIITTGLGAIGFSNRLDEYDLEIH